MTKKIKTENNMSSSGLTRRSRNKDLHADWMPDQVGHDRKEEQGRSMVEMLGTLAIIGVLSVGGIAGYTYSMNKYYANELLAGASARAVIVASQLASGREASLSEFDKMKDTAGGTFDGTVKEFDDGIGIKVSGVKKAVCENLIKDIEGTDIDIETEAGGEVTCGDENEFYITFANMGATELPEAFEVSEPCNCPEGYVYFEVTEPPFEKYCVTSKEAAEAFGFCSRGVDLIRCGYNHNPEHRIYICAGFK